MSEHTRSFVHEHRCGECGRSEPWPGVEHDAFCSSAGLCAACEALHRHHCACLGITPGVGCDMLDRQDLTEADLDRAFHDSFRWPAIGAAR